MKGCPPAGFSLPLAFVSTPNPTHPFLSDTGSSQRAPLVSAQLLASRSLICRGADSARQAPNISLASNGKCIQCLLCVCASDLYLCCTMLFCWAFRFLVSTTTTRPQTASLPDGLSPLDSWEPSA
ncbi:hypothetical protein BDV98DRAFT_248808 [Pterulicium gracile]|uniref:Uncharacterized protein n=1 Tax=Pterulicium gracile TaxID=1884261 RepID=A0A5C3Q7C5_9AGAR|nr:hypothetical protein BDV98DRAFT_248808 [Pterula gracilis]